MSWKPPPDEALRPHRAGSGRDPGQAFNRRATLRLCTLDKEETVPACKDLAALISQSGQGVPARRAALLCVGMDVDAAYGVGAAVAVMRSVFA